MESDTQRIALGLRQRDIAVLETLVEQYQYRLVRYLVFRRRLMRQHNVQFKVWAAFAVALSMSIAGSALVYQVAKLLTVPMHFDTAQAQAGVVVFWLLPSFCAALCLLAAPGENRGIA
jgi:hypothetical protein